MIDKWKVGMSLKLVKLDNGSVSLSSPYIIKTLDVNMAAGYGQLVTENKRKVVKSYLVDKDGFVVRSAEGVQSFKFAPRKFPPNFRLVESSLVSVSVPTFTPKTSTVKSTCTCKLSDLCNYGCKCGAFKQEMLAQKRA